MEQPQQQLNRTSALGASVSLFISLIAISFAPSFIKLSEYELSPNVTIFNRFWIATMVLGLWKGLNTVHRQLSQDKAIEPQSYISQDLWLLLGGYGAFFAAAQLLWAWSLTQTSVAISTVLHNLTPLFTSLWAWLLFGRSFDRRYLIGMIVAVGGVTAIGLEDLQIATGKIQGDLAGILSAVCTAMYLLIVEQLRTKLATTTILLWGSMSAALIIIPILLFSNDRFFPHSVSGWFFVIFLALICQILGQGLIAYSLNRLSSGFVAITTLLDPVLSSIEAWAIFSETISFSNWVAFAVILLGIYLAASSQSAVIATATNSEQSSITG